MKNYIAYIPEVLHSNFTVYCRECGAERIAAFQCTCGRKFCRSCSPNSFQQDEFEDVIQVTCPDCGATTLFD